jgi:hypothetical protein
MPVRAALRTLATALLAILAAGCLAPPRPVVTYRYFVEAQPGDVWFEKVRDWQRREGATRAVVEQSLRGPGDDGSGLLRKKFAAFAGEEKRRLAGRFMKWAQDQAMRHYRLDEGEDLASDEWPTSEELFRQNGNDCDGIDLISYNLLLELGFRDDEIFRAVIRRDRDGEFHMVTLWFEDPGDPWVVDTTGAMTMKLRRVSEVPGWTIAVVFNAKSHFTAHKIETWTQARAR